MKVWMTMGMLGFGLLCACQGVSGISSLEVFDTEAGAGAGASADKGASASAGAAAEADAGIDTAAPDDAGRESREDAAQDAAFDDSAGAGGASGAGGAGANAGAAGGTLMDDSECPTEGDAVCNWIEDCGCAEGEHCQARGAEARATCVSRGDKQLGQRCTTPDDCAEGTCDEHICRPYCDERCDGGRCLPAAATADSAAPHASVCWLSCQVGSHDSCPEGLTCQVTVVGDDKAAFCLPPADPCPSVKDGICDEPTLCAPGTDAFDCSCDKPEGAECNPLAQCGCPEADVCRIDIAGKPVCEKPGPQQSGQWCEDSSECAAGLGCVGFPYATCKPYCATPKDCPGGSDTCVSVIDENEEDIGGYKVCFTGCSDMMSCPASNTCVEYPEGPLCIPYRPEIEGAQCSLTWQLGCEAQQNTSCFPVAGAGPGNLTASCVPLTRRLPAGATCAYVDDCDEGLVCQSHVCRYFCDPNRRADGCDQGTCIPAKSDGVALDFGFCAAACVDDSDCDQGQTCAELRSPAGAKTCLHVPMTTDCPVNDGRCDEPQGTGLCAEGFDTADCGGAQ